MSNNITIFIFSSTKAAGEIAFLLRANWDGCNGIELTKPSDNAALKLAASVCNAEYCQLGQACNIASDRYSDLENDEYQQIMLRVVGDIITERSKSKIVVVEQNPEYLA